MEDHLIRAVHAAFRSDEQAFPALTLRGGAAIDAYADPPAYDPDVDNVTDLYLKEYAFNALPYLDPASWRRYLPAMIDYALRHLGHSQAMVLDGLLCSLRPPDRVPPRLTALTQEQESVIVAFLERIGLGASYRPDVGCPESREPFGIPLFVRTRVVHPPSQGDSNVQLGR